jgi:hypothetical protein
MKGLMTIATLVGAGFVLKTQLPEIKRYMKISQM